MPQLSALPWMLYFFCSFLPLMMLVIVVSLDFMKGLILVGTSKKVLSLKW
uniref:ATP synthase F0 subunit 8 n=1 Tax=Parachtes ignavus TaxID=1110489 RepID=A0A516IMJ3_9ARAC|nr:ATP synthase F0 subunit 8 [Parachtes ignavus]